MAALLDLSDEIQLIDQAPDHYGVEVEDLFYAVRTCGMLAVIIRVFEAEKSRRGASSRLMEGSAYTKSRSARTA